MPSDQERSDDKSSPQKKSFDDDLKNATASIGATDQKLLDQMEILAKESLEDGAGFFSKMWLSYLTPLLRLGASKPLTTLDLGGPSSQDKAENCYNKVMGAYIAQPEDKKSISKALVSSFGVYRFLYALSLYVISAALQFLPVMILNDLIKYFQAYPTVATAVNPWLEVIAMFAIPTLVTLLQARHNVIMCHMSVYVRTAVSIMIYEKIMKISSAGRAKTSTGAIVNMMSNDTTQVQRFIQFMGFVTTAPFQVAFALYLIYQEVGVAMFAGVAFLVALIPVNVIIFVFVGKNRRATLKESDSRVKLVSEILNGIRIIKFYAWESPFRKSVEEVRKQELYFLTRLAYISAIGFSMIMLSTPIILPIVVFAVYTATSNDPLDAAKAFTTVALFNIMRFPFAFMPMGFLQYIQAKIAMGRIDFLLKLPELEKYVVCGGDDGETSKETPEIIIENGSFSWGVAEKKDDEDEGKGKGRGGRRGKKGKKEEIPKEPSAVVTPNDSTTGDIELESVTLLEAQPATLCDINLKIDRGKLYGVVGSVGAGKSSLLSCILGDMEPLDPSCNVKLPHKSASDKHNYTSYCSQTPWVVNDTLRGNILFGRAYDEARYAKVVQACALIDDLAVLPAGDLTEIGEKGINLSGGQKARVSLARALYNSNTQLMLLDDPLSAVDSHVGEHLFDKAINGSIAEGKTRLLVTHHVHFLPRCHKVIMMKDGKVEHCDTYQNLIKQGVDFTGAVKFKKDEKAEEEKRPRSKSRSSSIGSEGDAQDEDGGGDTKSFTKEEKEKGKTLTKDEDREEGSVSAQAYYHYCKAGGWWLVFGILFVQACGKASEIGAGFWLAIWADESLAALFAGTPLSDSKTMWYLNIYALLAMGGVLALTVRSIFMAQHRLAASEKLHEELTTSIMRAPVSYFDVTPTGRILNRFAADMDKIDLELTQSLAQGTGTMFNVAQAYVTISVATKGVFVIPLIPISVMYYFIQKWFRKSSTEIQRVENITRSPIFSDFSQTLSGTSTIRAYGEEDRFTQTCKNGYDVNNASYQLVQQTGNWLGIRLDMIGGFISAFIAGLALATVENSFIPAGWVGLALLESQQATNFLKHGVRMIAHVEANMSSVERVLNMSQKIAPEAPEETDNDPKDEEWPTEGRITVKGASMRYRDGPEVLKQLSFDIEGGKKIGVVGRTGSGKSSLMTSLFRIVELFEGQITIDDVDISKIGTLPLRSKLSIIPQDPTLFSNTVKYNLDPFANSTEEEIWDVLDKCQLGDVVKKLPGKLEEAVTEGGSNFSQGQRQLLCIARSVLRKPKILVCDEATASIDNETDRLIQEMIRECFKDSTVLTIAHRLGTVMDSDKVLVLDDGKLAEFDSPNKLMKIKGGIFRGMVEASEKSESSK